MTEASTETLDRKPCPMCGEMIPALAAKCRFCGHYLDPSLKPKVTSSGIEGIIVPANQPWSAILSLYLGLFSVIFFAPIALIVSIVALHTLKKNPEMSGRGRTWFGLIMGIIFTGVLGIFIVAIASGK